MRHFVSLSRKRRIPLSGVLCLLLVQGLLALSVALGEPVSADVARTAAEHFLPQFYPGPWTHYTNLVYYDLEGDISAYGIVFVRPDSASDIGDLGGVVASGRNRALAAKEALEDLGGAEEISGLERSRIRKSLNERITDAESEQYGIDNFATLITAADDTEPVVLKCHKGIPVVIARKQDALDEINARRPSQQWRVRRYLYLSPFDETYEMVPKTTAGKKALDSTVKESESVVVEMRTRTVEKAADLRQRISERKQMKAAAETETQERARKSRKSWNQYRAIYKARAGRQSR